MPFAPLSGWKRDVPILKLQLEVIAEKIDDASGAAPIRTVRALGSAQRACTSE